MEGSNVHISQSPQVALGRAIRLHREERGLPQEALADIAVDPTSTRGFECGIANPIWDVADRIARALGQALDEFARRAGELKTVDRRPTNRSLRKHD
jgi:transcriptional regulator with XRE-family HTH domain